MNVTKSPFLTSNTPTIFYAAMNYMPCGDVLSDTGCPIVLKVLVQADSPSSSLGVGAGWRGLRRYVPVSPYVAVVWDKTNTSGTSATYGPRYFVGLSIEIDPSLGSVKNAKR